MGFYSKMKQTVDNVSVTENGMTGYKTTYHPLLDMNFKISSYRSLDEKEIVKDFLKILNSEDAKYALRFLFMVRDVREGLGERRLFRTCIKELIKHKFEHKETIVDLIITKFIPEYGRYDDLFVFEGTGYESVMFDFLKSTLSKDCDNMSTGHAISLLAKWMPSINTSCKETKRLASKCIKAFGTTPREYRKLLSALRSYLKVLEVKLSANEWDEVDYNTVPSKANLKYKEAFLRHDEERRRDYLAKLRLGDKTTRINSSVNYPHEIVASYRKSRNYDEALEQLWKNLKQMPGLEDTIVVRDGSGSMTSLIGGTKNIRPLDVSTALAIYCSERLNADFKDKFITFSFDAKLIDLSKEKSLSSKLTKCYMEDEYSNTNLANVFELIYNTAAEHKMKPEDLPKQILIVSDMEFDPSGYEGYWGHTGFNCDTNVIKAASRLFANAGYKLPKLVFWNVASRSNTIPCKENENGVVLVSGFSVNTLKMVLNGETDPYKTLEKELNSKRYSDIPLLSLTPLSSFEKKDKVSNNNKYTKPSWLK